MAVYPLAIYISFKYPVSLLEASLMPKN